MNKSAVFCLSLVAATVFVVVSVLSIDRINPDPQIGGDASHYISLTRGTMDSVPSPFRFRILVPFLAGNLPFTPGHSLMVITYCSLLTLFVVLVCASYKLTQDLIASVIGVLIIFSSRWFLYNFQNPYLTDAFSLAAIGVSLSALLSLSVPVFTSSVVLGILARETVLPFSVAWGVTRRWKQTFLIAIISGMAYVIPRLIISSDVPAMEYFATAIRRDGILANPINFLSQFTLSWGYIFLLAIPGFMFFHRSHMPRLLMVLVVLFVTAILSCLVAVDFGRMFEILGPVFALSCAQAIHTLRKTSTRGTSISFAFLLLIIIQSFTVVPNVLLPDEPPTLLRLARESFGVLITAFTYISILTSSKFQLGSVISTDR